MMKIKKTFLPLLFLVSVANAAMTFPIFDVCQKEKVTECKEDVRKIQIALNKTRKVKLSEDGVWGQNTYNALIDFQNRYKLKSIKKIVKHKKNPTFHKFTMKKKIAKKINKKNKKKKRQAKRVKKQSYKNYEEFKKNINLRRSYAIYKNKKLLKKANGRNTRLDVDISEQRVRLYVNNKIAIDSPCTTGAKRKFEPNTKIYRDKRTPKGRFKIMEKIADKRSTIFGVYYKNGKKVYKGDRRKYRGNKNGLSYKGASLKNWMRLTSGGIGLHASKYIKRHPGTNGCIRLPYSISKMIFRNVRKGTRVSIKN